MPPTPAQYDEFAKRCQAECHLNPTGAGYQMRYTIEAWAQRHVDSLQEAKREQEARDIVLHEKINKINVKVAKLVVLGGVINALLLLVAAALINRNIGTTAKTAIRDDYAQVFRSAYADQMTQPSRDASQ